jgi:hypothetical protein
MPIFTRPRRSRRFSPTQRVRAFFRTHERRADPHRITPTPTTYVIDRGTVLRTDVAAWQTPRPAAVPFEAPRAPVTLPDRWPFPGSCTSLRRRVARVGYVDAFRTFDDADGA